MKRELFVGNAALVVPHFDEKAGRNGEGAVPYRSIFLSIELICVFTDKYMYNIKKGISERNALNEMET